MREYDPNAKVAPPLRTQARRRGGAGGPRSDGTIDCIATDHAPHALSGERGRVRQRANGVVGLETAVRCCLDRLVRTGRIGPARRSSSGSRRGPRGCWTCPAAASRRARSADITVAATSSCAWIGRPARFRSRARATRPSAASRGTGAPLSMTISRRQGGAGVTCAGHDRPALSGAGRRRVSSGAGAAGARRRGPRRGWSSTPAMTGYQEIMTDPSYRGPALSA